MNASGAKPVATCMSAAEVSCILQRVPDRKKALAPEGRRRGIPARYPNPQLSARPKTEPPPCRGQPDASRHWSPGARTFLSAASPEWQHALPRFQARSPIERCCGQECPRSGSGAVPGCAAASLTNQFPVAPSRGWSNGLIGLATARFPTVLPEPGLAMRKRAVPCHGMDV